MISKVVGCCCLSVFMALSGCTSMPIILTSELASLKDEVAKQRADNLTLHDKLSEVAQQQQDLLEAVKAYQTMPEPEPAPVAPIQNTFIVSESTPAAAPIVTEPANTSPATEESSKVLVGRSEKVYFPALEITFDGRIDTGAESSSLDARDVKRFERDGKKWVRFTVYRGETAIETLERRVVRWVRVFQSTDAEGDRRPVVELAFRMGTIEDVAEFTLTDRAHLDFSVLIGRNILTDLMVVDVSRDFVLDN